MVYLVVLPSGQFLYDGPYIRFYFVRDFAVDACKECNGYPEKVTYEQFHQWRVYRG